MSTPDNRLRFDATLIDFENDVGLVSQDHETFPAAGAQPRWDWLLMWFISLLSNQSSYDEPTQKRHGTLWYDLNTFQLNIWNGDEWVGLSDTILVGDESLTDWHATADSLLQNVQPELTFSGECTVDGATVIPVPASLQLAIDIATARPFVYKNGVLLDPRNCEFQTTATIVLQNGSTLDDGDTFTVHVKNMQSAYFHIPTVTIS